MPAVHIVVLAFEGVSLFQLSVPIVVFGVVDKPVGFPAYDVQYCVQYSGLVISDQGPSVAISLGLEAMRDADIIVVSAWRDPEEDVSEAITKALKAADARGKLIVGFCPSVFVLGAVGLPVGREATIHWVARDVSVRRLPDTKFRPDVLYVTDSNIITSAGTVAAFGCCPEMIRQQHGPDMTNHITRQLVTPPYRQGGQTQHIEQLVPQLPCVGRLVGAFEWAREHLFEPITFDTLVGVAKMSRRTFTRRFRDTAGTTVAKWLNAERVTRAQ